MPEIHTENNSVYACWQKVRSDLKQIVESKGGEVKTCGVRFWSREIDLNEDTGQWSARGMFSKPSRWLMSYQAQSGELDLSDRIAYFSLRNEALVFVVRAYPVMQEEDEETFFFPEHTEWMVVFVAKSLTPRGSSSATAHAGRLREGLITITTDDRVFEVPLDCIGIIRPSDQQVPMVDAVQEKLWQTCAEGAPCYDLNQTQGREDFLQRVDALQLIAQQRVESEERAWMTEVDINKAKEVFQDGELNLVLWGDDPASLNLTLEELEDSSSHPFVHFEALPDWGEHTLSRLLSDGSLADKVICIRGIERVQAERVLPPIMSRSKATKLITGHGDLLPAPECQPKAWILLGSQLTTGQILRLHRTTQHVFRWFRCEAAVSATDAVKSIYREEGVEISATNWFDNLFVVMWDELKAHLSVPPETLAGIVRFCLRQDRSGTWDLNATPVQKELIVQAIESHLTPIIAASPKETRTQCINSIIGTLEISQKQAQRLLFLLMSR